MGSLELTTDQEQRRRNDEKVTGLVWTEDKNERTMSVEWGQISSLSYQSNTH